MTREEEALRRVLHAAADSLEPAPDGLMRIRERLSAPRPLGIATLVALRTALAALAASRLESARGWLSGHLRAGLGPLQSWFSPERPRHARQRPVWRRPAVAIAVVVVAAAAGGIALSGLPSAFSQAAPPQPGARISNSVSGSRGAGLTGTGTPYPAASGGHHGKRGEQATPSPSCSPSPGSSPGSPSPSPSASPSPSSSASPSPSASATTPGPEGTPSPQVTQAPDDPSPTASGSGADASAQALSASRLSQASPQASPSPSC